MASVLIGILFVTLDRFDLPPPGVQLWEWCFLCGQQWGIDFALNIALFIPLGLVLRLSRVAAFPAVMGMTAFTFLIEVLQLVIPGRITSVDDLLANTLGGIIGYGLGGHLRAFVAPGARQAVGAVMAAAVFVLLILWGTLWLFVPAPTGHPYWGQFAPTLGQFAQFQGSVTQASVGGEPLRNGRLANTDAVRKRLASDSVTVRAVVRGGGGSTGRLAPVVSIFDAEHNEVMLMGQSGGRSLTFRLRSRATDAGLRTPSVTVWNAFPNKARGASTPVRLSGTVHGYSITASASFDSSCVTRTIHFRPTHGWAYLAPFENLYTTRATDFTTIWLALIFAPVGYYGVTAVAGRRSALQRIAVVSWVAIVAAAALLALPASAGLSAATVSEWRGALLGLAAGALLAALVLTRLRSRDRRPMTYN